MSQHGAALQNCNQELVQYLEGIKSRRSELQNRIDSQEEERNHLQQEMEKTSYRLQRTTDSLNKMIAIRNEYDRTILETESAYVKIVESSQLLLNMLKQESNSLDQNLIKTEIGKQFRQ